MQQSPVFNFGPWAPDQPDVANGGLEVARNVIPAEGAYEPFPSFLASDATGPGAPLGGMIAYKDGPAPFMGTASGFYRRQSDQWVLESNHASTFWEFAQWGDEILALNDQGLHYAPLSGGALQPISAAGTARYLSRVENFIMLGGSDGIGHRLRWSGFNNRDIWGTDIANQSDFQDLAQEAGDITGIVAPQYATVFQERAITRLTYVGPSTIFQLDDFETAKGCIAPGSLVTQGSLTFFIAQDGPNVWDGQQARPIADGAFRKWFSSNFTADSAVSICGAIDWRNNAILWVWPDGGGTRGLFYSWQDNRATEIEMATQICQVFKSPKSTASGTWGQGHMTVAAVDGQGRYGTLDGPNLEATIRTGDFQVEPQTRSMVSEIWPTVDSASATVAIGSKANSSADSRVWGQHTARERTGMIPVRAEGRFHAVELRVPAGEAWKDATGVQVGFRSGART